MSQESLLTDTAPSEALAKLPWPLTRLREGLLSDDASDRKNALTMTVLPDVNIDGCAEAIVSCLGRGREDPVVVQLAVIALGRVIVASEKAVASNCLLTLVSTNYQVGIRAWAAHGFNQLGVLPEAAWPDVVSILLSEDASSRKTVLLAIKPFILDVASHVVQAVAAVTPDKWTLEALTALADSAGTSTDNKRRVEHYVMRGLQGFATSSAAVAGYAALARLDPKGAAPMALAVIAGDANEIVALAAIDALSLLGVEANATIPKLVEVMKTFDSADREEALCAALLNLKIRPTDIPLPRVLQRIVDAPGSTVLAYCSLLSAHPKVFVATATVIAARHAKSGESLRHALSKVNETLTGTALGALPTPSAQKS